MRGGFSEHGNQVGVHPHSQQAQPSRAECLDRGLYCSPYTVLHCHAIRCHVRVPICPEQRQYVPEGNVETILGVMVSFIRASWKKYDPQGISTGELEIPQFSSGRTKSCPIEAKNTQWRAITRSIRPEPYQTKGKGKGKNKDKGLLELRVILWMGAVAAGPWGW